MARQHTVKDIHLKINRESKRLLVKALSDYEKNISLMVPEAKSISNIKQQVTTQWNDSLPTIYSNIPRTRLFKSLLELKSGKLAEIIATTKDSKQTSIVYVQNSGYVIKIETEPILSTFNIREIERMFTIITIGVDDD